MSRYMQAKDGGGFLVDSWEMQIAAITEDADSSYFHLPKLDAKAG